MIALQSSPRTSTPARKHKRFAPVNNHHHEYRGGGAFATVVLRHVQDVAFALVSRWLPCTLYPRASQAGMTRLTWCEALREARSSAARW